MSRSAIAAAFAVAVSLTMMPLATLGQGAPTTPSTYRPGLGDLMMMTVQPRHIKMGLAGQERNWALVGYELHELEESLERSAKLWPKWRDNDIAGLIIGSTKDPIEELAAAAKAGDATRFNEAYGRLTAACNACHQSTKVGMIVIQFPWTSSFPNQDFRPVKP
jgi:hypothetical protein